MEEKPIRDRILDPVFRKQKFQIRQQKNSVWSIQNEIHADKTSEKQNVLRKDPHIQKIRNKEILFFLEQGKSSKDQKVEAWK